MTLEQAEAVASVVAVFAAVAVPAVVAAAQSPLVLQWAFDFYSCENPKSGQHSQRSWAKLGKHQSSVQESTWAEANYN
jgi:hypothetical protein